MPISETEVLAKIDRGLEQMIGSQAEVAERVKQLEASNTALTARALAADEKLKTQDAWIAEVQKDATRKRFGTGVAGSGDALLEALPDDLRAWIPRVRAVIGEPGQAGLHQRTVRFAGTDPVMFTATGGFFCARIQAALAMRNGKPQDAQRWNERAEKLAEAMGGYSIEQKVALQEDVAVEGGNLVPTVTEAQIGWLMKEASVVRASGPTMVQMTTKTHNLPSLNQDFTSSWVSEEGTIADSVPAGTIFNSGALTANKNASLVTMSVELVQDNIINLMDFVLTHLLQQAGRAEDVQVLEGTGSPFTGLFSVAGTNSVAGGSNALSEDEIRKLIFGGEHWTTTEMGVVFCHPFIVRDAMGFTTGTAGSIWSPYIFGAGGVGTIPTNFFGVRVYPTSTILRNRGTGTNETTAYFGRPTAIVIGERMGTTFDVDPYGLFTTAQVRLRMLRRVAVLIWIPAYFTKLTAVIV